MNYLYSTMMYINVLWTQMSRQWMYMADRRSKEFMDGVHEFIEAAKKHKYGVHEFPIAPVLTPFQHVKPFVTVEDEKSLGTQMFNFHRWYLRTSNDQEKMFGVKYRDHDFFRGEEDFWVYFENLYHIYHRQALDASIITI